MNIKTDKEIADKVKEIFSESIEFDEKALDKYWHLDFKQFKSILFD